MLLLGCRCVPWSLSHFPFLSWECQTSFFLYDINVHNAERWIFLNSNQNSFEWVCFIPFEGFKNSMFICKGMKEFLSNEVWPRLSLFSFRKSLKINTCILDHPGKPASIPEPKLPSASGGSLSSPPAEGAWPSVMVEETFLMGLGLYYLLLLSSQLVAECAKLFSLHFEIVLHRVNKNASLQELQVVAGIWGWGEDAGEGKTRLFLYPQGLEWIPCRMLFILALCLPGSSLTIQPLA